MILLQNDLVVKHNDLIEARYSLNLNEQKIILLAVSKIERDKNNFNMISFGVKEFTDLIDSTPDRYSEIREIVRELRKKEIIINDNEKELIMGWLSSIEYKKREGEIELEFSEKMMPYLLQLKNRFTRYQLKNILSLKNKYSIRIYELAKQYEKIGERFFEIEDLKKILMLEGLYDRVYDFEKKVLQASIDEINSNSDIQIELHKKKKGRKVIGFTFKIKPKFIDEFGQYLVENYNIEDLKKKMGLEKENFNAKQIIDIYSKTLEKNPKDEVDIYKYVKINYLVMIEKGTAKNKFSYLMKALEEDFANATVILKYSDA